MLSPFQSKLEKFYFFYIIYFFSVGLICFDQGLFYNFFCENLSFLRGF